MSGKIRQLGGVVSVFISIVSQLVVTVYALKSGGLGGSTATLLVLFALPVLGDILARQKPLDCEDYGDDLNRVIYRMTESVNNREEVAVSGLQEYILKRWDEATLAKMKKCEYRDHEAGSQGMTSMLHNLVWVGVKQSMTDKRYYSLRAWLKRRARSRRWHSYKGASWD